MHTRKVVHQIGVCGSLLLVLLLVQAASAARNPTSAQEIIITPVIQTSAVTTADLSLWQPMQDSDANSVGYARWQQLQQGPGNYGPDSTDARNQAVLPDAEEPLLYVPRGHVAVACPIDSDFNGTAPGWYSLSGTWYYNSEYLYTYGLEATSSSASHVGDFDNFDYEVRMWRSGCDGCANRLICRGTPDPLSATYHWYNEYTFQYARNGNYSVYKIVAGGANTAVVPWTYSSAINQGDAWNTLRVAADGTSLAFYINGTLLWSGTDSSLSSGRAGVGMYADSTDDELRVDWARLCTLPYMTYLPVVMRQ